MSVAGEGVEFTFIRLGRAGRLTGKLGFFMILLVLADNLHELGQNVAQHSFGQCAHLAVDDLSA